MKLVIEYDVGGGYECGSYPMVRCCEYDSKVSFLTDFEIALQESIDRNEVTEKENDKIQHRLTGMADQFRKYEEITDRRTKRYEKDPTKEIKKPAKVMVDIQEKYNSLREQLKSYEREIKVAGLTFEISEFTYCSQNEDGRKNGKTMYNLPKVSELEEWFQCQLSK